MLEIKKHWNVAKVIIIVHSEIIKNILKWLNFEILKVGLLVSK